MKRHLLLLVILVNSISGFGQFLLTGEFRPKFELRDGYKKLLSEDEKLAYNTAQRSRLNFNFKDDRIATRLSIQDVRIWGESPSKSDVSSLNVFEAWAELRLTEALSVKLGRQELSFDQNRLMGASNWNDVGSSHDLLLFKFQKDFLLQTGFAYNNDKSKNTESNYPLSYYKTLAFIRGEKNLGKYLNGSLIFIADGNQKAGSADTIYQRLTYGGNLHFSNDSVRTKIYTSFYLQNGKTPAGIPINAWFFSINLDYRFTKNTNGILGIDYFSGDDAFGGDEKYHSFNNLYGNGHSFYGYMDYFSLIDNDTKRGGLMDVYIRANQKLSKKTSTELTWHYFAFTNSVADSVSEPGITKKADPCLGSEIDFSLKYKITGNVELSLGYSTMLASKSMVILKGGSHSKYQQWGWLMLTFKPEFFSSNKYN